MKLLRSTRVRSLEATCQSAVAISTALLFSSSYCRAAENPAPTAIQPATAQPATAQPAATDDAAAGFPEQSNQPSPTANAAGKAGAAVDVTPKTGAQPSAKPAEQSGLSVTAAAKPTNITPLEPASTRSGDTNGPAHRGFYFRANSGAGVLAFRGNGPAGSARITGFSSNFGLSLGGSIAPGLVLAGTIQTAQTQGPFRGGPFRNATVTATDGTVEKATNLAMAASSEIGLLVDFYPKLTSNWHLGASFGIGMLSVTNLANNGASYGAGFGGSVFGGYDWHVIRDWSIGLNVIGSATTKTTFKNANDQKSTDYEFSAYTVGIQTSILCF